MKSLIKSLLFLLSIMIIVAFFLPWLSLEISGVELFNISGLDLLTGSNEITDIFKDQLLSFRIKILIIPLFCIFIIIVMGKNWSTLFYNIPAIIILGYFIYYGITTYDMVSKGLKAITLDKDIMDKLVNVKGIKEKLAFLDIGIIGIGLYMTVIGFVSIVLLGIKDIFTKKRRW